ncbi:MAG TPA: stage 0 sporulation family protein [Gemmatimonadales bacterium]|jgi:cell fate regulator YaaT (PSP1 superfamily)|nr:stage 0 sporulation family protein [Gemmatimonadales bacterium]
MDSPLTVEVRFKGTRKAYFHSGIPLHVGDAVVVDAERGRDFGHVTAVGEVAEQKCGGSCTGCAVGQAIAGDQATTIRNVIRQATPEDQRTHREVRASEEDVRRKVMERVRAHELVMKVSDCEWQWDRAKLTIYFTAEKRVDFRALVRDLASLFRTRIELRQIGVRDEAARLGGVGRCGREYCCSSWLKELTPVNLGLAKDQHLSLNPSQISGGCGRLLCCLKYEHEFYVSSRKRFPREGKVLQTARGAEKVVAVDIFRERVYLRSDGNESRIIPLVQLKQEMADADNSSVAVASPPPETRQPADREADAAPSGADGSDESPERRRRRRRRRDRRQDEP